MKVFITGAGGNLGSILARYLLDSGTCQLRLMVHRRDLPEDLKVAGRTEVVRADLGRRETLGPAVEGVDVGVQQGDPVDGCRGHLGHE